MGVACPARTGCVAVGWALTRGRHARQSALAEAWDGTRWTAERAAQLPLGAGLTLDAVSCPSPGNCTAAGAIQHGDFSAPLLERR
jgi:hypothetical protein